MNILILNKIKHYLLIFIVLIIFPHNLTADDWSVILDLKGDWKFNIGDDERWSQYDYDDSGWDEIYVPSSWEDEGYYNYNGYAWYRKEFILSEKMDHKIIYLSLGYIDDVDEVYLNGKLVGSTGSFPPNYGTAYNAIRRYPVPIEYFNKNRENVIAVKVYDSRLSGGILTGDISLMIMESMFFEISLEGFWKFKTGDDPEYKERDFNDDEWNEILVPSKWEVSGYPDYDGYGWYRKEVYIPSSLVGEKLVLMLGKIDDLDECFINGQKVGGTGDFTVTPENNYFDQEYLEIRGYYLPDNVFQYGEVNVISVRVYDGYLDGGIYHGPIGIVTQEEYRNYWKDKRGKKSFWDYIFD